MAGDPDWQNEIRMLAAIVPPGAGNTIANNCGVTATLPIIRNWNKGLIRVIKTRSFMIYARGDASTALDTIYEPGFRRFMFVITFKKPRRFRWHLTPTSTLAPKLRLGIISDSNSADHPEFVNQAGVIEFYDA